jgi:hypothetical protein
VCTKPGQVHRTARTAPAAEAERVAGRRRGGEHLVGRRAHCDGQQCHLLRLEAALDSLTASLARALAPAVRVVSIAPGLVDTEFVKSLGTRWRDEQTARTPLQRLAAPADVGRAVVAAVQTLTFSTGCVIAVDGGRPLG